MSQENVMSWILDANGARPSEAVMNTQGFKDAVRVCEENSRAFAEMAKNLGVFDEQSALATQFERIRDLVELPNARFLDLAKDTGLEAISQALAAIEKSMPDYQECFGAISAFKAAEEMLQNDIDLVTKSSALHDIIAARDLAEMAEFAGVMKGLEGPMLDGVAHLLSETSGLQQAMESMQAQWRDIEKNTYTSSFASFVELQSIGLALENIPTFDDSLVAALRIDLGDWRDSISWKPQIFTDDAVRSSFYESLGFNRFLTNFPAPVFERSLDIAGLRRTLPTLVTLYGEPVSAINGDVEEEDLVKTNTAHDWLLRLEMRLREFIGEEMTKAFGVDWPKHRLPNGLCDQWEEKQNKAWKRVGQRSP
jgi:hypothetical protein